MTLFKPKWKRNGKRTEGRYWWVDTTVNGTRVRRSLEVADKRAAQMKEAEIIRGLELKAAGLDTHGESADTTVKALVGEYERELVRRCSSPTHTTHTTMRIRALLAKAHRLTDVTPAFVRKALSREQTTRDLSARTVNGYRVALSGLFAWLVQEGRWETNPVQQVKRVREAESTRQRRALDDDELTALLDCAEPDRVLCYLVAVTTGLRRSELAALRWADIDLERATARVRASTSKNRKEAWQPLPPSTVEKLKKASQDGERVFAHVPTTKQLRRDLSAADVPYETADGVADLHALRVTYATRLAKAGVSLVQAQRLMRHSDPKLTANIYTRLRMDDAHAAVARIDVA